MSILSDTFPGTWRKAPAGYSYFLPASLQLSKKLSLPISLSKQLEDSSLAMGKFSSLIEKTPNPDLFIHAYTNKEATLSCRIEGTRTQIEDAFKTADEIEPEKKDDWGEVAAYIRALRQATKEPQALSNRLIKSIHHTLLSQARGKHKQPGEFRSTQNWIGGSRPDNAHFVPPAQEYIAELMGDLEMFIHKDSDFFPALISAALIHYQFETIHPFSDGNGRLGRMLISLYLLEKKIITRPILYISTFFEEHRKEYYDMLDRARENHDGVLKWISFFLDAVLHSAKDGSSVTQKLLAYDDYIKNKQIPKLGSRSKNALALLEYLYQRPIVGAKHLQKDLGFSAQISQSLLKTFSDLKIVKEITGQNRNRKFVFYHYIDLLTNKTNSP